VTDPAKIVRASLSGSRAAGVGFDEAWRVAYALVPGDGVDGIAWRNALLGTRRAWGRAYLGLPATAGDRAVHALLPVFDRGEGGAGGSRGGVAGAVLPAAGGGGS